MKNDILYNRDLSWLGFNYRVLQEANDKTVPLYERLKFLAIFSSNLDEFFRVRYPAVMAFARLDKKTIRKEILLSEDDIADKVQATINKQLNEFGHILNNELLPELKKHGIYFYYREPLRAEHIAEIKEIFLSKVLSFIQPIFLGPDTPFKFLPENNELYFVVTLKNNVKGTFHHVLINIPSKKLSRFFVLTAIEQDRYVVFIDDIIRDNISIIFPGQDIHHVYSIKFNRDAEIFLEDEYSRNLLDKIESKLSKRDMGAASRFLYEKDMPVNLRLFLASIFKVQMPDMFEGGRYHNLSDLFRFPSFDETLFYKNEKPVTYPSSISGGDIFNAVAQKDILLHLPYHSYSPVLSFFNQAAVDPDVTSIYITLYRVAAESHIVNALISAAKNGKKVTAFIELKARFDEANNIKWSRVMKKAGVTLIYSDPAIKVHSKIALVKKRVQTKTQEYGVLSTGNFNETTATFYTDHVLMTTNKKLCSELSSLFSFLEKQDMETKTTKIEFKQLFVSGFNLLEEYERFIDIEIDKAKKGLPALIRIKVNNLEEPYFIDLLYKAGKAGVKVNLIIRSICCLTPAKAGESENITVRRIVDKYLEHTRIFIFGQDEEAVVAIGSADLMTRNLRHRIEVCVDVRESSCRKQLLDYFNIQWQDNTKAVQLTAAMEQVKIFPDDVQHNAQTEIYQYIKNNPGD